MTGSLFPEFDTPAPAPVPTTAPLFELAADSVAPAASKRGPAPEQPHRVARDGALFDVVLTLPADDAGVLAFGLTV